MGHVHSSHLLVTGFSVNSGVPQIGATNFEALKLVLSGPSRWYVSSRYRQGHLCVRPQTRDEGRSVEAQKILQQKNV